MEMYEETEAKHCSTESSNESDQCCSTLVDEVEKKYLCDADVDSSIVFLNPVMGTSPCKIANECVLEVIVLNHKSIDRIGEVPRINSLANHVFEVDLAWNALKSWKEVSVLLELPRLRVLNISHNPLERIINVSLPVANKLDTLIVNDTNIPFSTLRVLISKMPALRELHLSENRFIEHEFDDGCNTPISDSVQTLHLNRCDITQWETVLNIRVFFPSFDVLFLSDNNIKTTVLDTKDFQSGEVEPLYGLRNLNLNRCLIDDWSSVERLAKIKSLHVLRLQQVPLLEPYSSEERIHLLIGRLPYLEELNGSRISEDQRIESERFFIRYYDLREKKPEIFGTLVRRHGHLEQLCNLDLTPKSHANVVVICEEIGYKANVRIRLAQTVGSLMRTLEKRTGIPVNRMRLFYLGVVNGGGAFTEELRYSNQKLFSLRIEDGEQFSVESKIVTNRKKPTVRK